MITAEDVAEFAEAAGMTLTPWQKRLFGYLFPDAQVKP
jgi:hypothetical protein